MVAGAGNGFSDNPRWGLVHQSGHADPGSIVAARDMVLMLRGQRSDWEGVGRQLLQELVVLGLRPGLPVKFKAG